MQFKKWLTLIEAKFDPSVTKPQKVRQSDTHLHYDYDLDLDNQGNVISPYYLSPTVDSYLTINPKTKTVDLQTLSPQSTKFRRIILAIKSKYPDIEDWIVQRNSVFQNAKSSKPRTVGYWLRKPEIRLFNKMPKYFYHGTSTNLWYEGIKQKGLVPRNITGSSGSYGSESISSLSYDDLVYLSTDPDASTRLAAGEAADKHGGKPLIIRIDTTGLDPSKLYPDEDSRKNTAQASVDVMSTLAYKGKIPASNLEPFLLKYRMKWEKFHDVPVEEHPVTQMLKKGSRPSSSTSEYYALKDAGLINRIKTYPDSLDSSERDIVNNTEDITDAQVKKILSSATWVQNFKRILNYINNRNRELYNIETYQFTKEALENPIVKKLIDSGIASIREQWDGKTYLQINRDTDETTERNAISLAKMLGKNNFEKEISKIKELVKQ